MMLPSKGVSGVLLAAVVVSTACGDDGTPSEPVVLQVIEETMFAPSLGIDLAQMTRSATGLYVQVLEVGEGEQVVPGSDVTVAYTGRLSDARMFDSGSFRLVLGTRRAIDGFDEGVTGMRLGEQRRIVLPPALAYGSAAQGSIPGGSILIFDLELTVIH